MAGARPTRLRVALATAATIIGGLAAVVPAAPVAAAPVLSVTPTQDLLHGHPVTVTGEGLPPATWIKVAQCAAAAAARCAGPVPGPDASATTPSNVADVHTSAAGTFSATLILRRSFTIYPFDDADEGTYDCTAGGCSVGLIVGGTYQDGVPVTFQATGTYDWPDAQLTVTPSSSGVVEYQRVGLQAAGLNPRNHPPSTIDTPSVAWAEICRAVDDPGPDDCMGGWSQDTKLVHHLPLLEVAADGTAQGSLAVLRYLDLPGGTVDCAVEGCTVVVTQGDPVSNRVPIVFGPEWTPYASAEAFLQVLERIRDRPLPAGERATLAAALADRSTTGAEALATAAEQAVVNPTTATRALIDTGLLYRAFFGRGPETGGLAYWSARLQAGLAPVEASRAFGGTAEFQRVYGTSSNAKVVDRAYRNTLGRAPDAAGLAYWTGRLDQGLPRWKMIHGFGRSTEFIGREIMRTTINVLVWRVADRAPTRWEQLGSPLDDWTEPLVGSVRYVATELLASGELP